MMAKKKEDLTQTFVCKDCKNALLNGNSLYCVTRMFDVNTLSDYAKVSVVKDCKYFKKVEL